MPDIWPLPDDACPHGFTVGTLSATRRSLEEWPERNERAECIFCGTLIDLSHLRPRR